MYKALSVPCALVVALCTVTTGAERFATDIHRKSGDARMQVQKRQPEAGKAAGEQRPLGVGPRHWTILVDINQTGRRHNAVASDFAEAGVKEDLTGVGVIIMEHILAKDNRLTGGGLTLRFSSKFRGAFHLRPKQAPSGNALLDDYVYFVGHFPVGGPADVCLSGLSGKLAPRTNYKLYLFGTAGKNAKQNSQFKFPIRGGATKTAAPPPPSNNAMVVFRFMTGDTVDDTLKFNWLRSSGNTVYDTLKSKPTRPVANTVDDSLKFQWIRPAGNSIAALNGFAITPTFGPQ